MNGNRCFGPGDACLILLGFFATHAAVETAAHASGGVSTPGGVAYALLVSTMAGGAVALVLSHLRIRVRAREPYRTAIGWAPGTPAQWALAAGAGAALGLAYLAVSRWGLPPDPAADLGPRAMLGRTPGLPRLLWAAVGLAIAPPVEEFVFRGVVYSGFVRRWSPLAAGAMTTGLFLLMHVREAQAYWPALGTITALGAVTVALRARTGCVGPAVVAHVSYNAVIVTAALRLPPT